MKRFTKVATIFGTVAVAGAVLTSIAYGSLTPIQQQQGAIQVQLNNHKATISVYEADFKSLDSKVAAYWTTIRDVNMAKEVAIPDSPQAYCQNLPQQTTQFEGSAGVLLCGNLETRAQLSEASAQLSEALPLLEMQLKSADDKFLSNYLLLTVGATMLITSIFSGGMSYLFARADEPHSTQKAVSHA